MTKSPPFLPPTEQPVAAVALVVPALLERGAPVPVPLPSSLWLLVRISMMIARTLRGLVVAVLLLVVVVVVRRVRP